MRAAVHRGKAGFMCSDKGCRTKVSAVSGGLLEGSHLSEKNLLLLMYFWAHDCAGTRAEEMLGHGSKAVAGDV